MRHLNLTALEQVKIETAPYEYTIVPGFLSAQSVRSINETYPAIDKIIGLRIGYVPTRDFLASRELSPDTRFCREYRQKSLAVTRGGR